MKDGIAVAGSLIVDHHYAIDSYPEKGNLTRIRGEGRTLGGTGNMICQLAKMDPSLKIRVSAILGEHANGQFVRDTLAQYPNVEIKNISVGNSTPTTIVMNALDDNTRTFFFNGEGSDDYGPDNIDWELIDSRIFHLEYLLLMKTIDSPDPEYGTVAARILKEARDRGMLTSIDVVTAIGMERASEIVRAALRYTDYCTINELEAEMVTGIKIVKEDRADKDQAFLALDELRKAGVSRWAVIHSPSAGFGLDCETGEKIVLNSLKLPEGFIKGTTGAGDAYLSGILLGAIKGMSLIDAMKTATGSAACSLSEVSGYEGLRPFDEVMEIYRKYCSE